MAVAILIKFVMGLVFFGLIPIYNQNRCERAVLFIRNVVCQKQNRLICEFKFFGREPA